MRRLSALPLLVSALLLVACAAPAPGTDAALPSPTTVRSDAAAAETPAVVAPRPDAPPGAKPAPPMSDPLPPQRVPDRATGNRAVQIDASCRTSADCTVKDVGNCCGYYPACVNVDSPTDPRGVQAQCAKSGMASVCGFQEIRGCQCVQGQCRSGDDTVAQ